MQEEKSFHMTAEEFRRHGRAVVDWIADYWQRVESLPGALEGTARRDPRGVALLTAG